MTDATLADRLEALEMRLTYQDETIETLNQTVTAQWKQIDALHGRSPSSATACGSPKPTGQAPPTSHRRIIKGGITRLLLHRR